MRRGDRSELIDACPTRPHDGGSPSVDGRHTSIDGRHVVVDARSYLKSRISSELVSRLLASPKIRPHLPPVAPLVETQTRDAEGEALARALLDDDAAPPTTALARDAVLLRAVPAAMIALERLWLADACSFVDVTMAAHKIFRLARAMDDEGFYKVRGHSQGSSILLAPVPGNCHSLGILLIEAAFMRSGWDVLTILAPNAPDIIDAVRANWFEAVGLSIASEQCADNTADLISQIRRTSMNASIVILIGGAPLKDCPEMASRLGADASASDAPSAVETGRRLVETTGAANGRHAMLAH